MRRFERRMNPANRQTGGVTVFTAVLVLFVLTLMVFYATRVGLFEQRVSANELRQKSAFHAAEAAVDQGMEYMIANTSLILSKGTDGWFADDSKKWFPCTDAMIGLATHPCGGDTPMPADSFFFDDSKTTTGLDSVLPLGAMPGFADDVTARLSANICFVDLENVAGNCGAPPGSLESENTASMLITLLGYGFSDCSDITDVSTCHAEATVARPLANFKHMKGSPNVPLAAKGTFPPSGTALVVPNPNGSGVGVPLSVWLNGNVGGDCPSPDPDILSHGSWNTCEFHEFYERDDIPADVVCDQPVCDCTEAESISYSRAGGPIVGIDILLDDNFPCDLFKHFFGVDRDKYGVIKQDAQVLPDCSSLNASSSGLIWISGPTCDLKNQVGSPGRPVILITAASNTKVSANLDLFGVIYVFDGEDPGAEVTGNGGASVFGSLIVDADMDNFNGTVNVVYSAEVLARAAGISGIGSVNGGWRDFGLPDLDWL